jgi:KOW motif
MSRANDKRVRSGSGSLLSDATPGAPIALAWAHAARARLAGLGVGLEMGFFEGGRRAEKRVVFCRDAAAAASNAYLALVIDSSHVEVSLEVRPDAALDVRNLRARLADPSRALELVGALEALPEQFTIGLASDDERMPARRAAAEDVRELLEASDRASSALWLGWSVPRAVASAHSGILDEQLADAMVALGAVYKLVAWAPDNDLVPADREQLSRRPVARSKQGRERAEGEGGLRRERRKRKRRNGGDVADEELARGVRSVAERETSSRERDEAAEPRRLHAVPRRPRLPSGRGPVRRPPIEKGSRVRVLSGPFAGKTGVVQELDGRGGARVLLGLLAIHLDTQELVGAEGGARPILGTSHRRPLPAR